MSHLYPYFSLLNYHFALEKKHLCFRQTCIGKKEEAETGKKKKKEAKAITVIIIDRSPRT
jgi:hypothetical protein